MQNGVDKRYTLVGKLADPDSYGAERVAAYNVSYAHSWFTGMQQYFTASAIRTGQPRLASNCVGCGACTRHCPQHIDIPARLRDVQRRLQPGPIGLALKVMTRSK